MPKRILHFSSIAGTAVIATLVWNLTTRAGYESAEYKVIESDGNIEIREYPDLVLAVTDSDMNSQGRDGSFMRLFRYISGANEAEQKIDMTTPVFMEEQERDSNASMGFVMPMAVVAEGVPDPKASDVRISKRPGGRFAVIRFAGRMDSTLAEEREEKLRAWLESKGLEGEEKSEAAGYDPPFTPPALRRNEVLIRLKPTESSGTGTSGR